MATVITMKDILKARDNMERDQHNPVQAGPVQEILPQKPEPTTTIRVTRSIRAKDSTTNYEIISNVNSTDITVLNQYLDSMGFIAAKKGGIFMQIKRMVCG